MTPTATRLAEALHVYFLGEKIEALVFILPLGFLCLAFGGWLLTDGPSGFTRGVAIPLLVMGALMGTVGAVVGYRTPAQVARLEVALASAPGPAVEAEIARMEKVNGAWKYYLAIWGLCGVGGLLLRFATRGDFTQGLGIALVFCAGLGLLVDGFAERRTHPYTAALEASTEGR